MKIHLKHHVYVSNFEHWNFASHGTYFWKKKLIIQIEVVHSLWPFKDTWGTNSKGVNTTCGSLYYDYMHKWKGSVWKCKEEPPRLSNAFSFWELKNLEVS
jgi:hypothetical protein